MTIIDAVILGIIQGLTEFLPISSSGHLVIGESLLGLSSPGISLEIWLHFGTLLAVVIYFRRRFYDIFRAAFGGGKREEQSMNRTILAALVTGTVPAAIVGVLFKTGIETAFDWPHLAAVMLVVTGIILISTRWSRNRGRAINVPRGLAVGCAQVLAILPGISRSGSTIACGMFLGIKPSLAAEFSFLLAAPIIALAFFYDVVFNGAALFASDRVGLYLVGMAVSFVIGMLAIHFLLKIIRGGKFYVFGFYCLVAGVVSYILLA